MQKRKFADAYGQELWDFYKKTGANVEIVERDDGLISTGGSYNPGVYFSSYKDWRPIDKKAIAYARGRVLDIGCGAGRHSLYLQKRGYDATGIDNSPLAIKVCRMRGLKKAKVLSIDHIGRFKNNSFDSIIMMGNNFGLFGSFKKAKTLLKTMHRITSDNALIIAQTTDPSKTKNPDHLKYQKRNRTRGRMPGQIRLRVRYNTMIGPWFDYLLVSEKELKQILAGTGWMVKRIIHSSGLGYIAVLKKV